MKNELDFLARNQHLTDQDCRDIIGNLEAKIEYSDAYISTLRYREQLADIQSILILRKKWGIKV